MSFPSPHRVGVHDVAVVSFCVVCDLYVHGSAPGGGIEAKVSLSLVEIYITPV
jgi:hypothetical protein